MKVLYVKVRTTSQTPSSTLAVKGLRLACVSFNTIIFQFSELLITEWFLSFFLPATNCRMGESLPRHQHPLFKWLLGDRDFGRPCEDKGLEHSWSTNRQFLYREWYHHQVISLAHYSFHIFVLASAIHIGYPKVWNILRPPPPPNGTFGLPLWEGRWSKDA